MNQIPKWITVVAGAKPVEFDIIRWTMDGIRLTGECTLLAGVRTGS